MRPERYAVVVTTINPPTEAVREIAAGAERLGAEFVIIGDGKSPPDFRQPGAAYLDLAAQRATGFRYAVEAPANHYARKNVGYLAAIRRGATVIVETDDDNFPVEGFWAERRPTVEARLLEVPVWANVYAWFAEGPLWPRGLPLQEVRTPPPALEGLPKVPVFCPIQQGLADGNPDVDAIYRLTLPLPVSFREGEPVALRGAWCPFNSQNTTFFREAFPLLYLPRHCSFRMTDIWRSFVAQRIAYANGWGVLFHGATVRQERNEHDLLRDFEGEVPGYLNNGRIREALEAVAIAPGEAGLSAGLIACYRRLVELGLVAEAELPLLDAWLEDLSRC